MKILNIKQLQPSQVNEIIELDRVCFEGLWTAEGYLREIDSPNSDLVALHLTSQSKVSDTQVVGVGCLWAIVNEAHITLLGVEPEHRKQGLGKLILLDLLERAISRQLEWATLEVNVNNSTAINLYQKLGFEIAGTRKGYYQATGEDALILWCKDIQSLKFSNSLNRWKQELSDRLKQNQWQLN